MIKCHYKYYLLGFRQTLHRVMYEIRRIKQSPWYHATIVTNALELIENELMQNELYEAMPRHIKAKHKILKKLS